MKKNIVSLMFLASVLTLLTSCGGNESKQNATKQETTESKKAVTQTEAPSKAEAPKVETSKEMEEFLNMFKGSASDVAAAIDKFASPALKYHEMKGYDLKNPKVVAKNEDCYTIETNPGTVAARGFVVCWSKGKINRIDYNGLLNVK
ncbi:MAG: hypothetical protein IPJ81_02320 [Chitinophagaceae bacterium]|nr:hypothetical protein [Chitinophagaceae bacterium]